LILLLFQRLLRLSLTSHLAMRSSWVQFSILVNDRYKKFKENPTPIDL
jgi:hypothetical protein